MGIRLNRFLGYGLTDVAFDPQTYSPVDPRINPDSILFDYGAAEADVGRYAAWLDAEAPKEEALLDRWYIRDLDRADPHGQRQHRDLHDTIAYNIEHGLGNVLVLQPLGCGDWSRYADPIDYAIESALLDERSMNAHVAIVDGPLYPFSSWMDARTGRTVRDQDVWVLRNDDVTDDRFAREAGFDDLTDARAHLVPLVPHEIRAIARYANLFTSPDVAFQLRPVLYTYWA